MAPKKGPNDKQQAGRDRKAAVAADKEAKVQQQKLAQEAEDWKVGAKSNAKKEQEEAKKAEAARKKAEKEALLAAEEQELASMKKTSGAKRADARSQRAEAFAADAQLNVETLSASGIDDALDLLDIASKGTKAASSDRIERHPERRVKSAYSAFEERELPILKEENPGLRLSQLKQQLQKRWKKSIENPMNQVSIGFDTTRDEERAMIEAKREALQSEFSKS